MICFLGLWDLSLNFSWHEALDVAGLECPAGVLCHLAWQWGEALGINAGAAHGNHAKHLAVAVKDWAATAAVSDVLHGGYVLITNLFGILEHQSLG